MQQGTYFFLTFSLLSYVGMKETIAMVRHEYGSIESYVRDKCHLSDADIAAIRKIMIVPIRREEKQLYRAAKL